MFNTINLFSIVLFFSISSFAQESRIKIDSKKPIRIEYKFYAWNKNPDQVDTAALLFRDANSGRVARIELQETGPNTGNFVGSYNISWENAGDITPEVYVAPQEMMKSSEQLKKIEALIKEGTLLRKPLFARSGARYQLLTVFDSREQAFEALENYRKNVKGKDLVDPAALEAQRKAQLLNEQARLNELARQQEMQRLSMTEQEKRKIEDLRIKHSQLDAAEKARREREAKRLADQAMGLYKQEKYLEAEKLFEQATQMDPNNTAFFYQYGVTLYKNDRYNKSLVTLSFAKGKDVNPIEKEYFIGLNHMKLKEFDTALKDFEKIKQSPDKTLGATAAFLSGIIEFQREKYQPAKSHFEYVLDNSSDPKMDQQAESYIEQIANLMAFEEERKKKFILTLTAGLQYDSNILAVSNSQAETATNLDGYRWAYGLSAEYRMVYDQKREWSAILSANDMYSMNKSFTAEKSFQDTDPLSLSLYAPYKIKTMAFGKAYQLAINPGYETTQMNQDGSGARETIVNSTVLKLDNTLVMNEDWFSNVALELRNDVSQITPATPAADQTATKYSLNTTNTFFQDKKKTEAWIAELHYSMNQAKGDDQKFNRYDLAATYLIPAFWETSFTTRVAYAGIKYPNHSSSRSDANTSLTLGLSKPINAALSAAITGNYTTNKSNVDASDYKKYLVMTVFTWKTAF